MRLPPPVAATPPNASILGRFARANEDWAAICRRVAALAGDEDAPAVEPLLLSGKLVPAGQILRGAGRAGAVLFNSYAVGIRPSESLEELAARITNWTEQGVGIGVDVSPLLAAEISLQQVATTIGRSQETLWRRGITRTATMILADFDDEGLASTARLLANDPTLRHLNMAVRIDDATILAAENDGLIAARLRELVAASLDCGNPGYVFVDRVNREANLAERVVTCNACAEQFLDPDDGAPLCSINLAAMVADGRIDWPLLRSTAHLAVRLLDRTIGASAFPDSRTERLVVRRRRVGLGVMGLDSALRRLRLAYGSEQAVSTSRDFAALLRTAAVEATTELAAGFGPYPEWTPSRLRWRNAGLLSIAPTGGISTLWGVSSGIEPIFGRRVEKEKVLVEIDAAEDLPLPAPDEIHWRWQLAHVAAWQSQVDGGISKTVSMPRQTDITDALAMLREAWRLDLKSISLYRTGSRPPALKAV